MRASCWWVLGLLVGCGAPVPGSDDTDPVVDSEVPVDTVVDSEVPSDTDTDTDVVDTDTDLVGDTDTDLVGDTDTDVAVETDTDVAADTDTDVAVETDTDVAADTDLPADSDTDAADTVVVDTVVLDTVVLDTVVDTDTGSPGDTVVPACSPGSVISCYEGRPGTLGVGICSAGTATCAGDGSGYGDCVGDELPVAEDCGTPDDDNCDGQVNEGCPVVRTYTHDAQPILQAHCAPCHTTGGSGGANHAASYADTQLASYYCPGKTKGACTIVRVQDGSMPRGAGCTGDPAQDAGHAACLTAAEQATLQAWIDDGQLP